MPSNCLHAVYAVTTCLLLAASTSGTTLRHALRQSPRSRTASETTMTSTHPSSVASFAGIDSMQNRTEKDLSSNIESKETILNRSTTAESSSHTRITDFSANSSVMKPDANTSVVQPDSTIDPRKSNLLPSDTTDSYIQSIYARNIIPSIRERRTYPPQDMWNDISKTRTPQNETAQNKEARPATFETNEEEKYNSTVLDDGDMDDIGELTIYNATELEVDELEIGPPIHSDTNLDPGKRKVLTIHLQNDDHSVLVTWQMQRNLSATSGFIVSYKMEGREDYDSSKLGKEVRAFTLHSLHEDKEYVICVTVLNGTERAMESCERWSKPSSKVYLGIIAGVTMMVPCIIFITYIHFKDRAIKQKQLLLDDHMDTAEEYEEGQNQTLIGDGDNHGLAATRVGQTPSHNGHHHHHLHCEHQHQQASSNANGVQSGGKANGAHPPVYPMTGISGHSCKDSDKSEDCNGKSEVL